MNAIKINPFCFLTGETIRSNAQASAMAESLFSEVQIDTGIQWIYNALSYAPTSTQMGMAQPVDTFEAVPFSALDNPSSRNSRTADVMYVDENGLFNNHNDVWIVIRGAWQPFAGGGVVCGTNRAGDTIAPKDITVEWLKNNILILSENMVYSPRVQECFFTPSQTAVTFASKVHMYLYDSPFWTGETLIPS